MRAHADDLRAEVEQHLRSQLEDGQSTEDVGQRATAFAEDIAAQGSEAAPDPRLRSLLQYAERLALAPGDMKSSHVEDLRAAGIDDRSIHDAAQVIAYFSYINRVADGLGVDLEPEMKAERPD